MLQIDNTIISDDVFEESFSCNLLKCKGSCCVEGCSGAPLSGQEINDLENHLDAIKPYMTESGIQAVQKQGVFFVDEDGDTVTTLSDDTSCAFAFREKGILFCAIEKAWNEGAIRFQKPLSCHLYPIRITSYKTFDAVNVHHWQICQSACEMGKQKQIPVYRFLKEPLIRKYGKEWYEKLLIAADYLKNHTSTDHSS